MNTFKSQQLSIQRTAEEVYNFITDFSKLGSLMPDRVVNWSSTADTCSFEIQGMAKLNMRLKEKKACTLLNMIAEGQNPFHYELFIKIFSANENRSEVAVEFHAELNSMLSMMASKPLQNLVELMVEKLKEELEG